MGLADIGQEAGFRIDAVLEPPRVEQPDEQDVLGVVPDVDHQPAEGDVRDHQVGDGEDREMRQHVKRVDDSEAAAAPSLNTTQEPKREEHDCHRCRD